MTGRPDGGARERADGIRTTALSPSASIAFPAQAWRDWSGFIQLLPGELTREAPAFIPTADMPNQAWFAQIQAYRKEVGALGCHFRRDVTITGQGYVFENGALLVQDVYLHGVAVQELADRPDLMPGLGQARECRFIERPVLEILGPGSPVYGHWLVDFLPRAAIAHETLGDAFHELIIPLPEDLPDWTVEMLRFFVGFKPQNLLRYNSATEFLHCRRLCVPTFAHGAASYFFHSFVRDFYSRFVWRRPGRRQRRICLSRQNFEHQTRGVLKGFTQRLYMEEAARRRDFEIVRPEELSLSQQIKLFSEVGIVVGEYGSALHNTLFSPTHTIVGSVRYPNSVQTRIAALMGQDVVYLIPDLNTIDERGAEIYSVAEGKIDRFLDQLVELHSASMIQP